MTAWKCEVCGYVHSGSEPPTSCPVCGAERALFSPFVLPARAAAPPRSAAWQCGICDHVQPGDEPPELCPVCGAAANLFAPCQAEAPPAVDADIRRLVVLGAGIAGLTAAEEARRLAPGIEIVLVGREPALPYYRLNLTRLLAGEVAESELPIHPLEWFAQQRIRLQTGEAVALDRERRQVLLRDGARLDYDRLVLANGAHPFIPPFPGATREGVVVLRTLEDARAILARLAPGLSVVCIGGGLLGLEAAAALRRHGAAVTVVEGAATLLPRQLPPPAGRLLARHLERAGVAVCCGARVQEIAGDESVQGVLLADGREFPARLVIVSVGVRPNSYLARRAGLKVETGVLVDDRMTTSDPAILAAGDIAEHRGLCYGIWPAAYAQGLVAAASAVGGSAEFPGLAPSSRLKVLDVDLFSIGSIHPEDASTLSVEGEVEGRYWGLFCRDGQVVGAALYGDTGDAGLFKEAVESGRRLPELSALLERYPSLATVP